MDKTTSHCSESSIFTIVCDDGCTVVRRLAALVKLWDKNQLFAFVDKESRNENSPALLGELKNCPWSLFLIDEFKERWYGPEAIPIILKNLPLGKFAAVFYILPGTMWLTHQIYQIISRSRHFFSPTTSTQAQAAK
jgi:predicted DCC family thiol-disulfide oxidoreductase YuxK